MKETTNYKLKKPDYDDYYNIDDFNYNTDVVDNELNVNRTDILTVKNELKKSVNTKYSTLNGIKEFECKDGYVDNIYMEGRTLVNISTLYGKYFDSVLADAIRTRFNRLPQSGSEFYDRISNGTFTLYNFTDKIIKYPFFKKDGTFDGGQEVNPYSFITVTLDEITSIPGVDFWLHDGWNQSDIDSIDETVFMILEGEYLYIPYFKGLKSIGQGNKLEILTRCENGNLFENKYRNGSYLDNGSFYSDNNGTSNLEPIYVKSNTLYSLSYDNGSASAIYEYDKNMKFIKKTSSSDNSSFTTTSSTKYINFFIGTNSQGFNPYIKAMINEGNAKPFTQPNYDKKHINQTFRSLPNGVKDELVKMGNSYYKLEKCEEVVLDDSKEWYISNNLTNCIGFGVALSNSSLNGNIISDKFKYEKHWNDSEHIIMNSEKKLAIFIQKSKLVTQDVVGFKAWLKDNPVTIVYELAEPKLIPLPNFNPQTFENKTTFVLNTGVVQGKCEFEITNSIGSEIDALKEHIVNLTRLVNNILGYSYENPSIYLRDENDVFGEQSKIIFEDLNGNQGVQMRYNTFDNEKSPYGLRIEKSKSNKQRNLKAYLDVEGLIHTSEGIVLGDKNTNQSETLVIKSNSENGTKNAISLYPVHANGHGISIGAGGLTVIGGGESNDKYIKELPDGGALDTEKTIVVSDTDVVIRTGCQSTFTNENKNIFHSGGGMSIGSSKGNIKKTTISTANPSGGSSGDIWLKYS